jgi:hypothetical protein
VAECVRLIDQRKNRGVLADIIVFELAENAGSCLTELIDTFRHLPEGDVRLFIMMALEIARLPDSIPFLAEVLRDANPRYVTYAQRALEAIDTRDSRKAIRHAQDAAKG